MDALDRQSRTAFALLAVLAFALLSGCAPDAPRPNILFIFVDDEAPGDLGYEGDPIVETPNIDRLAAEGTVFTRAYVPIPQCAPSRAAVLTSLYPHESGVLENADARLPLGAPTFATLLRDAGYRTGLVGKWHLGDPQTPQAGFEDFWITLDNREDKARMGYFDPPLWVDGESRPHKGYMATVLTDYAIQFIDADDGRPFLLWLNYKTPHFPYVRPKDVMYRYRPSDMPLPKSIADSLHTKPQSQRESYSHEWFLDAGIFSLRSHIARYYAMLSALDKEVGRLVGHLEERGLSENTLVIYMSDNGVLLGEHQMVAKGPFFYEEVVRVPLLFHWPGVVPAGGVRDELVSSLDLLPTFVHLAGAEMPERVDGFDIWRLVLGTGSPLRDEVFFEFHEKSLTDQTQPMLGVATAGFKYVRNLRNGDEEFYDLGADPFEMNNLARANVNHQELGPHRERLERFQRSIAKPFWTVDSGNGAAGGGPAGSASNR